MSPNIALLRLANVYKHWHYIQLLNIIQRYDRQRADNREELDAALRAFSHRESYLI